MNIHCGVAAACLGLAGVTGTTRGLAQVKNQGWDGGYSEKAQIRSDVALGAASGVRMGVARGWLNKAAELGRPEFQKSTGAAVGTGATLWFGGALKDWFVYAIGGTGGSLTGNGLEGSGGAFLIRLEMFPLVSMSRPLQDLGVATTFGIGGYSLTDHGRGVAEGGSMSLVGLSVFHESLRLGTFALGPSVEYRRWFSQSMTVDTVELGARIAYTTGP
jgi:hypothetical protein